MTVFDELIVLQEHDTRADQVRHRLANLSERVARDEHLLLIDAFDVATAEIRTQRDAVGREQRRFEDEVASITTKIADVDRTLYSGTITAPKELQAFQDDIASMKRRQAQLEDEVIELMEQLEPLDGELATRTDRRGQMDVEATALEAALDEVETDLRSEQTTLDAERAHLASGIAEDLLVEYERLRSQLGGVAVARLAGSNCGGCHLTLSAVSLDKIRHASPDTRAYCDECGRLLVH